MVEMLVGINYESNWLVGNQLSHFFDDGQASLLIQRGFKNRAVIIEFDSHAVMCCAAQQVNAISQSGRLDSNWESRVAHGSRNRDRIRAEIRSHVHHRAAKCVVTGADVLRIEVVIPSFMRMPDCGELDAIADV